MKDCCRKKRRRERSVLFVLNSQRRGLNGVLPQLPSVIDNKHTTERKPNGRLRL